MQSNASTKVGNSQISIGIGPYMVPGYGIVDSDTAGVSINNHTVIAIARYNISLAGTCAANLSGLCTVVQNHSKSNITQSSGT